MRVALAASAVAVILLAQGAPAHAEGWSLLRSKNSNVEEGNEKLKAGDAKGALAAYDKAARELPSEAGVHLNRGLALLRTGDLPKAREALHLATQPPASNEVRADAYYSLGVALYKEADARAGEQKHDEAQQGFREATEAFKSSLRKRPGDRNTAWNYELAARRLREQQEEKKKQDAQKKQDEQKQDQQNKDQQNQDQQNQDQQNQDQQKQDQQKQDQQKQDQAKNEPQKPDQKPQDQPQPSPDQAQQPPAPRPEVDRALDALQDGEENLERVRAMNRAAREQRKPEKDW